MPETTQEAADAFAAKLQAFNDGLTEEEQDLLGSVLAQSAVAADSDVTGFSLKANTQSLNFGGGAFMPRGNLVSLKLRTFTVPVDIMGW